VAGAAGGRGLWAGGLVTVVAAREHGGSKVSACSYLLDVYCLGVKNAIGPHVMDRRKLPEFRFQVFHRYAGQPLEVPLEMAQQLVFGPSSTRGGSASSLILTTRRAPGISANGGGPA
jgi:hypothetical protein